MHSLVARIVPRVKICCISSPLEAKMAVRAGANVLGVVSAMPSGPGVIPDAAIQGILNVTPPGVGSFLLTARTDAKGLIEQSQQFSRLDSLQLVDAVAPEVVQQVRQAVPSARIVQVVHVSDESAIADAKKAAEYADAILLDSGNPSKEPKELGGTGRAHDWEISRAVVQAVTVPVWLGGGLNPSNVRRAIETARPFGVDICSGVRSKPADSTSSEPTLDTDLLTSFFQEVRRADAWAAL